MMIITEAMTRMHCKELVQTVAVAILVGTLFGVDLNDAMAADHSTFDSTSAAKKHYISFFVRGGYPQNGDARNGNTGRS